MTSSTFQVKTLTELVRDKYGKRYMKYFEADIVRYVCYHSCGYKPNMHNYLDFDTFDIDCNVAVSHIDEYISSENILYLILCLNSLRKEYECITDADMHDHQLCEPLTSKHELSNTILELIGKLHCKSFVNCIMLYYTVLTMLAKLHDDYDVSTYTTPYIFDDFKTIDKFTTKILRKYCKNIDEIIVLLKVGINNLRKHVFACNMHNKGNNNIELLELDAPSIYSCDYDSC